MAKRGRKPGQKNGGLKKFKGPKTRGLRFKYYSNVLTSKGSIMSGHADQYGRLMEEFENDKNAFDIKPNGHSIRANH